MISKTCPKCLSSFWGSPSVGGHKQLCRLCDEELHRKPVPLLLRHHGKHLGECKTEIARLQARVKELEAERTRLRLLIRCEQTEAPNDVADDMTTEFAVALAEAISRRLMLEAVAEAAVEVYQRHHFDALGDALRAAGYLNEEKE